MADRPYIVRTVGRARTFYGPFATQEAAVVRLALTVASDTVRRASVGRRAPGEAVLVVADEGEWSIQAYADDELAYYLRSPDEAGWSKATRADPDKLPLTGAWAKAFKGSGPYTLRTVLAMEAVMPPGAGAWRSDLDGAIVDAAYAVGLLR